MIEVMVLGVKGELKGLPFLLLKNDILGEDYELSVAFVDTKTSQKINFNSRGKDYPTNVLSFPLSKKTGEIILCPSVIKKEYKKWNKSFYNFTLFLVIHGMLHLKGMDHGSIMEKQEEKFYAKHFRRNRRGNVDGQNSSRRISKRRKRA